MTIVPQQFTNLCTDSTDGSTVIWGSALLNWQGNVYVYGWSTTNSKLLYLAKTTSANLTDPSTWQTFDGLDSSGNPIWSGCADGNQLARSPSRWAPGSASPRSLAAAACGSSRKIQVTGWSMARSRHIRRRSPGCSTTRKLSCTTRRRRATPTLTTTSRTKPGCSPLSLPLARS